MRVFAVDPSLKPHMTGIDLKIMVTNKYYSNEVHVFLPKISNRLTKNYSTKN